MRADASLFATILTLASVITSTSCFRLLDLPDVALTTKPGRLQCSEEEEAAVILVHSAPKNAELRQTIRETWGGVKGYKRVFLLGSVPTPKDQDAIDEEAARHGDILQADFVDAYRNMTYKHVLGYWYVTEHCPSVEFVLKSDDDQAVDTLHLTKYARAFLPTEMPFLLCDVIDTNVPHREFDSKWFVTLDEYSGDSYPPYCAGWAYVTNPEAMRKTLRRIEGKEFPYFWIDDVFVTGIARPKGVLVYDWSHSFLHSHAQYEVEVFEGSFFTPELMVASDVGADKIRRLHSKFRESQAKGWADLAIYGKEEAREAFRPKVYREEGGGGKEEL